MSDAREITVQAVRNKGAELARNAKEISTCDCSRPETSQVRNWLTRFGQWVSSGMLAFLNIFDSIVGEGKDMPAANPRLSNTG